MAFLSQYRKLRAPDPQGMGEVEYNFGRVFHQLGQYIFLAHLLEALTLFVLGLYSHAVRHYECVLELAEKANGEVICSYLPSLSSTNQI